MQFMRSAVPKHYLTVSLVRKRRFDLRSERFQVGARWYWQQGGCANIICQEGPERVCIEKIDQLEVSDTIACEPSNLFSSVLLGGAGGGGC